jgi:hypothetical protein
MKELVHDLVETWPDEKAIKDLDVPSFLFSKNAKDKPLPTDGPIKDLSGSSRISKKRRKLTPSDHVDVSTRIDVGAVAAKVRELYQKYSSLFEWCDGPLVAR